MQKIEKNPYLLIKSSIFYVLNKSLYPEVLEKCEYNDENCNKFFNFCNKKLDIHQDQIQRNQDNQISDCKNTQNEENSYGNSTNIGESKQQNKENQQQVSESESEFDNESQFQTNKNSDFLNCLKLNGFESQTERIYYKILKNAFHELLGNNCKKSFSLGGKRHVSSEYIQKCRKLIYKVLQQ